MADEGLTPPEGPGAPDGTEDPKGAGVPGGLDGAGAVDDADGPDGGGNLEGRGVHEGEGLHEGLAAGAVARRLGVAVTTLRTWHQRYGLGPSRHTPGRHRRYTHEDLARLEVMRRLTAQGIAPAEAAEWARRFDPEGPPPVIPPTPAPGDPRPAAESTPSGRQQWNQNHDEHNIERFLTVGRHGGGATIPLPGAGATARGLASAAIRLDTPTMRQLLERSVAERGVIATWDTVLRPVLSGIGERHASTGALVDVEHLVCRTASEVLGAVPRPGPDAPAPNVLLACADEEQHSLPLEALAAALAETGVASRLLGARVPPAALRDAVARTGPVAVVLWAQLSENADPDQLSALLTGSAGPLLVAAAGPGWQRETVPVGVVILKSLVEALTVMTRASSPTR